MLDSTIQTQLENYLSRLVEPIELVIHADASVKAREMRSLLEEIAGLSDKVSLRDAVGTTTDERRPSFSIGRPGEPHRMRFAGIPMGHEFASLVLALLQASGHPPRIEADAAEQIRALPGEYRFETYVSLSCQNCPDVVQALNAMAALHPGVTHVMVDGAVFQDEVERKGILSVPTTLLNGEPFAQGRMSLGEILAKLDASTAGRAKAKLAAKEPFDVLVVGGGPAGAAAAIYAARKGVRTGVVSDRFGGQVLDTLGIENFISVSHTEGLRLARELEQHVREYGVDIMDLQRAEAFVPGKGGRLSQVQLASGAVLEARAVIVATGARWREMNVPGEKEYRGRGVAYCPHCDGPLFKGKRVAVIGGGNSGVEAAIDLAGTAAHATLLEFADGLRADAVLQKKLRSLPNVTAIASAQTTEVTGDGGRVNGLVYKDRRNGLTHRVELEGVFVQIGLLPNTGWLDGAVALTRGGEIEVDARGQTSVPGVFAAGDATTTPYKQIVIAMGEGAKASLAAFEHLIRTSGIREDDEALAA